MAQILIDRDLLQRILDEYFEARAEARAYLALQQHAAVRQREPAPLHNFLDALEYEKQKEQSQTQGLRQRLQEMLVSGDDAAFLRILSSRFPT